MINYKHLNYFRMVAKEGGVARASERLHITPQTISGQLSILEDYFGAKLFIRVGRNLELTETGRLVLSYADEIFSLGYELDEVVHQLPARPPQVFRVGVANVVPKTIALCFLQPALQMSDPVRMTCHEENLDTLLAELAVHRLDLVVSDRPIPANVSTRGYSHELGKSTISFFATNLLRNKLTGDFPACLDGMPLLLPTLGTRLRANIDQWLDKHRIHPYTVAEFDDGALMKAFGQEGFGIFIAPTDIEAEIKRQYKVTVIGRADEVEETFYAITIERQITHPVVTTVVKAARDLLSVG